MNTWSDRQLGDWIRAGFYDYFINGRGRFAFEPLHTFFGEDYDVIEEMMNVFALLTEQARTRFRSGLSIALAETELAAELVLEAILNLARRTRATHILRVFSNKMLRDWQQSTTRTSELDHAIVWTIGLLARFAGESSLTDESVACLETLGRFDQMPTAYISPLFKLLCEARPTELVENLKAYWSRLNHHFGQPPPGRPVDEQEAIQEQLVKEVYEICGRDALLPTITTVLRHSDDQSAYSYNWWQLASINFLLKSKIELPEETQQASDAPSIISGESELRKDPLGGGASSRTADWLVHLRKNLPEAIEVLKSIDRAREPV